MTMLVPRRRRSVFDDFMTDPFDSFFGGLAQPQATPNLMRTDIKENDAAYEIVIDLPGFEKENVAAELKDGEVMLIAPHTKYTYKFKGATIPAGHSFPYRNSEKVLAEIDKHDFGKTVSDVAYALNGQGALRQREAADQQQRQDQ